MLSNCHSASSIRMVMSCPNNMEPAYWRKEHDTTVSLVVKQMAMCRNLFYRMASDAPDPRNGGDTHSWFFFYKWRAGETWVPAKEGCEDAVAGDYLWFEMDKVSLGAARISHVVERNLQGEKELHFDSDGIQTVVDLTSRSRTWMTPLCDIKEGEEPEWLRSLLTRKRL